MENKQTPTDRNQALRDALAALVTAVCYKAPPMNFGEDNLCWEARVPVEFIDDANAALAMQEPASEPAPASAPSCCGADDTKAADDLEAYVKQLPPVHYSHKFTGPAIKALRARAQPCQCGELREALEKIARRRSIIFGSGTMGSHEAFSIAEEALAATAPRTLEGK